MHHGGDEDMRFVAETQSVAGECVDESLLLSMLHEAELSVPDAVLPKLSLLKHHLNTAMLQLRMLLFFGTSAYASVQASQRRPLASSPASHFRS
jgi:hypothetical protein